MRTSSYIKLCFYFGHSQQQHVGLLRQITVLLKQIYLTAHARNLIKFIGRPRMHIRINLKLSLMETVHGLISFLKV